MVGDLSSLVGLSVSVQLLVLLLQLSKCPTVSGRPLIFGFRRAIRMPILSFEDIMQARDSDRRYRKRRGPERPSSCADCRTPGAGRRPYASLSRRQQYVTDSIFGGEAVGDGSGGHLL